MLPLFTDALNTSSSLKGKASGSFTWPCGVVRGRPWAPTNKVRPWSHSPHLSCRSWTRGRSFLPKRCPQLTQRLPSPGPQAGKAPQSEVLEPSLQNQQKVRSQLDRWDVTLDKVSRVSSGLCPYRSANGRPLQGYPQQHRGGVAGAGPRAPPAAQGSSRRHGLCQSLAKEERLVGGRLCVNVLEPRQHAGSHQGNEAGKECGNTNSASFWVVLIVFFDFPAFIQTSYKDHAWLIKTENFEEISVIKPWASERTPSRSAWCRAALGSACVTVSIPVLHRTGEAGLWSGMLSRHAAGHY